MAAETGSAGKPAAGAKTSAGAAEEELSVVGAAVLQATARRVRDGDLYDDALSAHPTCATYVSEKETLGTSMMDFPRQLIEDAIRDEICCASNDRPVPRATWEPEVDSLLLVRIVLRIEEEIGLMFPDDCMLSGGAESVAQCIETITATCERLWLEQQKTREVVS